MALRKTASPAVKLDSLSDVNDLGKSWRFTDEDTGLTVTRSCVWSPPGCHPVGCGLKLYTDESGRLVKVEGDENHPVTQGRLCVRCIALKDYEYNNSRILHPMKRDRSQRGNADAWEEITWDEALDLIEERYTEITGKYGKESFVNFGGTGREGGVSCMTYTAMVWQTPNACYTQSGYACYFPRLAAGTMSAGLVYPEMDYAGCLPGRYDDPEYHVPEAVVLWGKVPTVSNPDGAFGHAVIDLMKRGSRLIMVDSRVNWLTTRAAYHLQLRPGTDTAIAMAMLDVIIREGLYDKEFVDKWCYGFEQLAERVATMPPERAAEICGVKAEDIIGAARLYANAEAATIQWGLATDQKTNGMQQAQCIIALMAITGNIDRPGGQITTGGAVALDADTEEDDEYMPYMALDDDELRGKMIGLKEYPAYCGMSQNSHADLTLRCMETDDPYPLRIGAFAGNNLLACTSAEPRRWEAAINRSLEFVIGFDCFMTPSIQAVCDIVLPLATVVERDSTVAAAYGSAPLYFGTQNKCVDEGDCRGDLELLYILGKRLNPKRFEEFDSYYDLLQFLRFGKSRTFEELREQVCLQSKNEYYKYEKGLMRPDGAPGFNTPTGRVELYNLGFQQFGDDPLPYYEEPDFSPISTPELLKDYPFVLTTGARTYAFFHSEHRQIPRLRELNPNPLVEINPQTAQKLGIVDGQWCRVYNQFGEAYLKAKLTASVKPDVIHAQHGWWFPEEDGNAPHNYGVYRSNMNNLIPNFHVGKLGFGAPFKCMLCNIEGTNENFDTDMQLIQDKFGELR